MSETTDAAATAGLSRSREPLVVQWANARAAGNPNLALEIGLRILESNPNARQVRRWTARLLDVQGNERQAIAHWEALRDADLRDFEAAFHLAREALGRGLEPAAAVAEAAPWPNRFFRAELVNALAEPLPALEGEFKHVEISGAAYCGSTLLDRILGGLPGVKSIGESYWLTYVRVHDVYFPVNMAEPLDDVIWHPCSACHHGCPILTRELRRSLAADRANWYRKIAARLNTRILVSADKIMSRLVENDPLLELSALVVFKSPEQAWRSKLDKLPAGETPAYYEAECLAYMREWTDVYRMRLDQFRPQGPVVWMNFDAFSRTPEPLLRAACDRLGLPFDPDVLRKTEPGHAIGGNGRSMRRLREKNYAVVIEPLPDPALEPSHAEIIAGNSEAQATWREMLARHEELASAAS